MLHFMAAIWNRVGRYIFVLWFFLLSSFFLLFSSPNLCGRRLDAYHTSTHGVALVRISNAGLKCAACGSLEIQDAKTTQKVVICAPSHNFVGLYLHNEGMCRRSEKKLLNSNISSTCPNNMADFGPLTVEIGSGVSGTPSKFQRVSRLAIVTAATSLTGG